MDTYEITYIFRFQRGSARLQTSIMSDVDEVLLEESGAENELDVRVINLLTCMDQRINNYYSYVLGFAGQ